MWDVVFTFESETCQSMELKEKHQTCEVFFFVFFSSFLSQTTFEFAVESCPLRQSLFYSASAKLINKNSTPPQTSHLRPLIILRLSGSFFCIFTLKDELFRWKMKTPSLYFLHRVSPLFTI